MNNLVKLIRTSLSRGLLKLSLLADMLHAPFVLLWRIEDRKPWTLYHLLPKSPPPLVFSEPWCCLSALAFIVTVRHDIHVSRVTFGLLYRVDRTMVVLTEDNHSHVVSSRLIARMIISVPQRFKVDFFACLGPALDGPILAVQDTVSCIKGRKKPCGATRSACCTHANCD